MPKRQGKQLDIFDVNPGLVASRFSAKSEERTLMGYPVLTVEAVKDDVIVMSPKTYAKLCKERDSNG